jgi:hypothetical protein
MAHLVLNDQTEYHVLAIASRPIARYDGCVLSRTGLAGGGPVRIVSNTGGDSMKVQTNVKAGEHCWNALSELLDKPKDGGRQRKFCDCCANDSKCLY